jgi:hypothetical protein
LTQFDYKIFGIETIKDRYAHDVDFNDVPMQCKDGRTWNKFVINDVFIFRANKLCIPASSVRLLLLQDAHGGGLMGHFGAKKTLDILADHFFWHKCEEPRTGSLLAALHVKRLSHAYIHMVCIYPSLFQMFLGKIFQWILC